MAAIIDFPLERSCSAQQRALIDNAEQEGARFLKAAETLLGVLRQAERTQQAILAYQAEMKGRSEIIRHTDSRGADEIPASGEACRSGNTRQATDG
ncbi:MULTISPECIES: hypothetical protein [Rhizobium/Agrobacterium group]|uniref:hypothetical protein n=1 Tax=Rhizobium/Agrobacterium group TaxID=227290 RepID=UPI000AA4F2B6|nr:MULTISPECIES: hypothetical protein [Rhizobium/Agrobacterium group]NMV72445.1 hypothetical protein [Agrobacterium fabrum]NTF72759.1 hypothetical protein [Rhizobium rhizogenes]NTF91378.1 hypothetical protein [Rhizobium rhizogenes]NTI85270.1 hypothetical protein [Rhizobium rhizogenes]NTJ27303.1 hypothetical protein [Rhizobium rhizogenes]